MRFGSVCSGIEAASVAWHPLGWDAAWFSEIEPFPCAVLAHHYPDVPNLGDMNHIAALVRVGAVEAPDVFCGGTPCQAFSVAGLRKSLDDARGNLSLTFCEIANEIDTVRRQRGEPETIVFWENVPGVLSTKDNAFGCFLAGLAGEDRPLECPGGKWPNAGAVFGPARAIAWRVTDAQYFGVAQRRRRVFVVASAREGFDPAAVLFEFDGVRRDTAPSREQGQDTAGCLASRTDGGGRGVERTGDTRGQDPVAAAPSVVGPLTAACGPNGHGGSGLATDKGAEAGHILAFGGNRTSGSIDVSPALLAQPGSGWKGDFESETFLVQPTAHTLRGEGFDASEDGTPLVPVAFQAGNLARGAGSPPNTEVFPTLKADHGRGLSDQHPCVAFPANLSGTQHASTEDLAPSRGAKNPTAVAFAIQAGAIKTNPNIGPDGVGVRTDDCAYTLEARAEVQTAMQVRRLTPVECERLQGFPDSYTNIPWNAAKEAARKGISYEAILALRGMALRGPSLEDCPDGPRYKALGNSWAVPNVRWIGARIAAHLAQ